tara:strand:- start:743 stop:3916 length:3174 start_codon:yes stop_codon:yes gene_type:complete
MARTNNRTIATYNVIITLDQALARKFSKQSSRAEFASLLETKAAGLSNTAVLNNRDESFLSLDHKVAFGEGADDKGLTIKIEVLEPELLFLRTLLDTGLSSRLARVVEQRNQLVEEAESKGDTLDASSVRHTLTDNLPKLFPKVYIMYGVGDDLSHWAGPFESVLIDVTYANNMKSLETTKYTFVATPEVKKLNPEKADPTEEKFEFAVRVPLFEYRMIDLTGGGEVMVDGLIVSKPTYQTWKLKQETNRIADLDRNITELITHYLKEVGLPNSLVVLPDLDKLLERYLKNKKASVYDRLTGSELGTEEFVTSDSAGLSPRSARIRRAESTPNFAAELARDIYGELGLDVVAMSPVKGISDSPVVNNEEYIDLATPHRGAQHWLAFKIDNEMAMQINQGNRLAPITELLRKVSTATSEELMQPYWYWESNVELIDIYKKMIGTSYSLLTGSLPSSEPGLFVIGARKYIKNYLQGGIFVNNPTLDKKTQQSLLRGTAKHIKYIPPSNDPRVGRGGDPFWNRLIDLNDPTTPAYTSNPVLSNFADTGLPFFAYIQSIITKKFKTTSFFDPDLAINKIPDEFNYSQEAKEKIANFGIPVFRCNTSNPNVIHLNIKTEEGFFPLLNLSFSELQWTLANQTAAIPHKHIKASSKTITSADVLALYTRILEDYSSSDPLFAHARAMMGKPPVSVGSLAKNLATLLTTTTGLGMSKIHKKYTKSSSLSFLHFFFKLFNFRFSGQIRTLPMFEYSDGAILSRPSLLFVNRLNQVRQLYDGKTNRNPVNSFYSGLYRIFGFRHYISNRDAYSEFLVIKDPIEMDDQKLGAGGALGLAARTASMAGIKIAGAMTAAWHADLPTDPAHSGKPAPDPRIDPFYSDPAAADVPPDIDPWTLPPLPEYTTPTDPVSTPSTPTDPVVIPPTKDAGDSVLDTEPVRAPMHTPTPIPLPDDLPPTSVEDESPDTFEGELTPIITYNIDVRDWVERNTDWNRVSSDNDWEGLAASVIARWRAQNSEYGHDAYNDYLGHSDLSTMSKSEEEVLEGYWRSMGYTHPDSSPGMIPAID